MAYLKYKELTKIFNFYKHIKEEKLPDYAKAYINEKEGLLGAYGTRRDVTLLTTKRIIIFDQAGLGKTKQTTVIPYKSISTTSILYKPTKVNLILFMDSGYPVTLSFIKQSPESKTTLRKIYAYINDAIS